MVLMTNPLPNPGTRGVYGKPTVFSQPSWEATVSPAARSDIESASPSPGIGDNSTSNFQGEFFFGEKILERFPNQRHLGWWFV